MPDEHLDPTSRTMHPGFVFFPEVVPVAPNPDRTQLVPVQIHEPLLINAFNRFIGLKHSRNYVQRILNLSIEDDSLDFHLTFTLEKSTDKILPDAHIAIRKEDEGHNAVLYWWYQLTSLSGTKKLYWLWTGCAGKGDALRMARSRTPGVQYGTTADWILKGLLLQFEAPSTTLEIHPRSKKLTLS